LEYPDRFRQVTDRIAVSDFGPDECLKELSNAVFDVLEQEGILHLSQVYSRIESEKTAGLLTQLQTSAEQKTELLNQLEGAMTELENRRHNSRTPQMGEDDELKQVLNQIAQKGPNLRNAGIRS
jgi:hypothetical protein